MDYENVTVQDCLDMKEMKGQETVINDGQVDSFCKGAGQLEALLLKDWLDALAANRQQWNAMSRFDERIETCSTEASVHLYAGIEVAAETLGIQLEERQREDSTYPYQYSFRHNGTEFYQLSKKKLWTGMGETQEKAG